MVFPNDESCAMKYPKLVLAAASSADLWLAESSGELGELGSCWSAAAGGNDTGAEAVEAAADAEEAGAVADAAAEFPLLRSFFCRSSSSSIFLCWSIFPEEGLLSAPPPGPVPLDEFIAQKRNSLEKVRGQGMIFDFELRAFTPKKQTQTDGRLAKLEGHTQ